MANSPSMQVGILAASLATSSYAFFGNVAGSMTGVPPLVNDKLGKTNFSSAQKVRAWTLHFHHAHRNFATSVAITTALRLLTSYLSVDSRVRRLSFTSAVLGFAVVLYTLIILNPINAQLISLDASFGQGGKEADVAEGNRGQQLLARWNLRHHFREGLFGIIWATGLWAFFLESRL